MPTYPSVETSHYRKLEIIIIRIDQGWMIRVQLTLNTVREKEVIVELYIIEYTLSHGCFLKFCVITDASPVAAVAGHGLFEYSNWVQYFLISPS